MTQIQFTAIGCAIAISIGNVLFKITANSWKHTGGILNYPTYIWLALSLIIYSAATLTWILILQKTPLLTVYPFLALTFIFVPILSVILLGEKISWLQFGGFVALILGAMFGSGAVVLT